MKIIGHKLIESEELLSVNFNCITDSEIKQIKEDFINNECFVFDFNEENIQKIKLLKKDFAIITNEIDNIILSNACGAKYIIVDKLIAKKAQDIANYYLFDSKIAVIIKEKEELKELADFGVDVAIFESVKSPASRIC